VKLLFCNVGWMESYRGLSEADQIQGGGSYVKDEGMGHEVCNFAAHRGKVFGYVQPPKAKLGEGHINIDRLGGNGGDVVDGITVVWTATRPEGGTVVVGWYRNAKVYRGYQRFSAIPKLHKQNELEGYRIEAASSDAVLLPIDSRTCSIPRQVKGGMGQSNIWFADSPDSVEIVKTVRSLVSGKRTSKPVAPRSRKTDPEHNAKVEKAAVSKVRKHYEKISYTVESVEKDNVGWDLEARYGKVLLRIEVKGLSGQVANAQLSPNEYDAFSQNSSDYRLAIVTDALSTPRLTICRFSAEANGWVVDGNEGVEISIETRKSATVQACI